MDNRPRDTVEFDRSKNLPNVNGESIMGLGKFTPRKEGERRSQSEDYEIPPIGNHVAIPFGIYDAGTQWHPNEAPGQQWYEELWINFELSDEHNSDGSQMTIAKKYRKSMYESAILFKDLHAWLPGEVEFGQEFDITTILGRPCQINIAHKDANDGNTYANIMTISGLNARILDNPPDQINESIIYEIEDGPPPDDVPEFIRNKIVKCREFAGDQAMIDNPPDPARQRKVDPPSTGRKLFSWSKGLEDSKMASGVVAFVNAIGAENGWPKRMIDWDGEMVDTAYQEAVYHFLDNVPASSSNGASRPVSAPVAQAKRQTAQDRLRERQAANGTPPPKTVRRTPVDTSKDHDRPTDGKSFVAWLKEMHARHDVNIGKYIENWGKLQEYPKKIPDWKPSEVATGHEEAVRKLRSIDPGCDIQSAAPPASAPPPIEIGQHDVVDPVDEPALVQANIQASTVTQADSEDDDIPF